MINELITQTSLLNRGWTKSLMNKYYPKPSQLRNNPMGRSLAKVKLYDRQEVSRIEQTEAFKNDLAKAKKRSNSMVYLNEQKRQGLLQQIDEMALSVKVLKNDVLVKNAIKYYNDFQRMNGNLECELASTESDMNFLKRIIVNYIRYELTCYDQAINGLLGKVGKKEGFIRLSRRIYQKIAENYPEYAEESYNQLQQKEQRIEYLALKGGNSLFKVINI